MSLRKEHSKAALQWNIARLIEEGREPKQAAAISYEVTGMGRKKKKKKKARSRKALS